MGNVFSPEDLKGAYVRCQPVILNRHSECPLGARDLVIRESSDASQYLLNLGQFRLLFSYKVIRLELS